MSIHDFYRNHLFLHCCSPKCVSIWYKKNQFPLKKNSYLHRGLRKLQWLCVELEDSNVWYHDATRENIHWKTVYKHNLKSTVKNYV
jgi:hypothetical protein